MKNIAVLLTVYNRKAKTLQCLRNLFKQDLPTEYTLDAYLTDDGCTDGTPEAVMKQFPKVRIIQSDGDLFWNRGMLVAWQKAKETKEYDLYLWINDDTYIYEHTLKVLVETSEHLSNKCIVVGTTCAVGNPHKITYGGRIKGRLVNPTTKINPCDYFNGNIVLIPHYVFKRVGMNDPVFHHALGDFDYGLRAKKMGIRSFVAPSILGECDVHDCLPTWCDPQKTFIRRWCMFRKPLGQNPEEHFIFEYRHYGLTKACFHYLTNHLRVLFPLLWKYKR